MRWNVAFRSLVIFAVVALIAGASSGPGGHSPSKKLETLLLGDLPGAPVSPVAHQTDKDDKIPARDDPPVRWFGYNPADPSTAAEDGIWTFDHGDPDPLEGWTMVYPRHDPEGRWRWRSGEMHVGLPEDDANCQGYVDGAGYGNNWCQRLWSPPLVASGSSGTIDFDYDYELESGYDFLEVIVKHESGLYENLTQPGYSGTASGTANLAFNPTPGETFYVYFHCVSDLSYSDEDGLNPTADGAFTVDNVRVTGVDGGPAVYSFTSDSEGWTEQLCESGPPPFSPPVGLGTAHIAGYGVACTPPMTGNVLELHTGSGAAGNHYPYQYERVTSPELDLTALGGVVDSLFIEFDYYFDTQPADGRVGWRFQYYPYSNTGCTESGIWSPPVGGDWYAGGPVCTDGGSLSGDAVPANAEKVRFLMDVLSFQTVPSGGFAPLLDNIRFGVTMRPPTIQELIDAAAPGETVLVAPGTYTGAGNKNLDFGGKDIVVMSTDGKENTIIDCEDDGIGFYLHSYEPSTAKVIGFTIRNGYQSAGHGGGIWLHYSSATIEDCIVENCESLQFGGGIAATGNLETPTIRDCYISGNACGDDFPWPFYGGGIYVSGQGAVIEGCTIEGNTAGSFWNTQADGHGGGIGTNGAVAIVIDNCVIRNNYSHWAYRSGISIEEADVLIRDSEIVDTGNYNGYALYAEGWGGAGSPVVDVERCVIASDTAHTVPGIHCGPDIDVNVTSSTITTLGVNVASGGTMTVDKTILWGDQNLTNNGTLDITDSDVGMPLAGSGTTTQDADCFNEDPLFCWDGDTMEYTVDPRSMCAPAHSPSGNTVGVGVGDPGCGGGRDHDFVDDEVDWSQSSTDYSFRSVDRSSVTWGVIFSPEPEVVPVKAHGDTGVVICGYPTNSGPVTGFSIPNPMWLLAGISAGDSVVLKPGSVEITTTAGSVDVTFKFDSGTATLDAPNGLIFDPDTWIITAPLTNPDPVTVTISGSPVVLDPGESTGAIPSGIGDDHLPTVTQLRSVYPNPFNPTVTVEFDLHRQRHVDMAVYDVSGRLVRTLLDEVRGPGTHKVPWNGRDDAGNEVSTGVYFLRVTSEDWVVHRKLVFLK